jgi:hypothetical protein
MQVLDQAVAAIQARAGKGRVDGAQVAAKLRAIADCGEQAAGLWQAYLDNPGAPGDRFAMVTWVGAERAKQLYELSLKAHGLMKDVCAAAGDQARLLVLEESPVVLAYQMLNEGETGLDVAKAALSAQQAGVRHIRELAAKVATIKTTGGARPAAKKSGGKKPAAKKAAPKAAPKAAKKKASKKKPAARKPPKKVAKKKAGKKRR